MKRNIILKSQNYKTTKQSLPQLEFTTVFNKAKVHKNK